MPACRRRRSTGEQVGELLSGARWLRWQARRMPAAVSASAAPISTLWLVLVSGAVMLRRSWPCGIRYPKYYW